MQNHIDLKLPVSQRLQVNLQETRSHSLPLGGMWCPSQQLQRGVPTVGSPTSCLTSAQEVRV